MVILVQAIFPGHQCPSLVLHHLSDIPVGISSQSILVEPLVVQPLILNLEPGIANPLLKKLAPIVDVKLLTVTNLQMPAEELHGSNPSATSLLGRNIPALVAIRKHQHKV